MVDVQFDDEEIVWEIYKRKYELALVKSELLKNYPKTEIDGESCINENLSY